MQSVETSYESEALIVLSMAFAEEADAHVLGLVRDRPENRLLMTVRRGRLATDFLPLASAVPSV